MDVAFHAPGHDLLLGVVALGMHEQGRNQQGLVLHQTKHDRVSSAALSSVVPILCGTVSPLGHDPTHANGTARRPLGVEDQARCQARPQHHHGRPQQEAAHLSALRQLDLLPEAVRQKTRWVHGIAFQGWERMGWTARPVEVWMALRDRRGPLTALVLGGAYLLLLVDAVLMAAEWAGVRIERDTSASLRVLLAISLAGFVWRAALRAAFTAREYGLAEGARAVLRIPVANVIAIMAGRRALAAYLRSLRGAPVSWDKTEHRTHPVQVRMAKA